jgi:hypothetical protein
LVSATPNTRWSIPALARPMTLSVSITAVVKHCKAGFFVR